MKTLLVALALLTPAAGGQGEADLAASVQGVNPARIEHDIRTLAGFGTRHTLSETENEERGIGAARRWLASELEAISAQFAGGRISVALVPHDVPAGRRVPDGARIVNVVATLPGTDPDRLVVLSGHYDSRASDPMDAVSDAPGANDDASGTAAVLEAARVLGSLHPRATLVFLCVAGEEQGLLGAAAQAAQWKSEGKTIEAMFTLDIVGGATGSSGEREPNRVRVFSEGIPSAGAKVVGSDNDAPSRQLARYTKRAASSFLPDFELTLVFRRDRYLRGGDHIPFLDEGWPAVRLTEPHENYDWQHQDVRVEDGKPYGDVPGNVDFAYVGRVTGSVCAAAGELALAPRAPRGVLVDVTELTPHTRLLWDTNPEPDLAGYAVLVRRTHEPDWTRRIEVGRTTETLLEGLSKDDWLFAVEAVDRAGHRSLPVYPAPKYR
ncbi:MAG TPA: M20/M25/M40 family metallo-hydrolase [Planctomycetes bacterium]|nr:M20/M25/M40 family metallo-hydrolase [Planctomycetota bacterium]